MVQGDNGGEDAPLSELTELLRQERNRWRAWFAGLAVVVVGLGLLGQQAVRAGEREDQRACETRNDFKDLVAEIIDYVTRGGPSLDLTGFDGFADLDEPVRIYFQHITAALAASGEGGNQAFRDFAEPLLTPESCS